MSEQADQEGRDLMTESPEERYERLAGVIYDTGGTPVPYQVLDALLDALEPPVADMVRRGVEEHVQRNAEGVTYLPPVRTYSPRSEP